MKLLYYHYVFKNTRKKKWLNCTIKNKFSYLNQMRIDRLTIRQEVENVPDIWLSLSDLALFFFQSKQIFV